MEEIDTGYFAREQFDPFHARGQRWSVIVAHRRAGKTVACVNDLLDAALRCTLPEPRFAYIAPFYAQAKDIAWAYLKRFAAPIPGAVPHEQELRVDLPNGGRVRLYGADNYERLRGIYLDGVVMDEVGDMDPRAWSEVLRPALADRHGWAVFIGTPKGRNHFADIWKQAQGNDEWFSLMLKASATGIVDPAELADARAAMSEDQYAQEFECSFDAAVVGSYYGKHIEEAERSGRIVNVPWETQIPVNTWWDLGVRDSTAIWFVQLLGREIRIIDYYENSGVGLDHYAKVLKDKPYVYGKHVLPHDIEVVEIGSGKSRYGTLVGLGVKPVTVCKMHEIEDGINAVRANLSRCYFDRTKCDRGIEAMRLYRREWDDKLKAFKGRPLHDWTSHACLTGDAIVDTDSGPKRIDAVAVGDLVWTPAGYAAVTASGPVKRADELIAVTLRDGRSLLCTPEHKVFTRRGLVKSDALRYSDVVLSGEEPECSRALSFSRVENIGFRAATIAATTGAVVGQAAFTERFGKTLAALFRQAMRFIMSMGMAQTTTSQTWSAFSRPIISGSICSQGMPQGCSSHQQTNAEPGPPSGTPPLRGLSGTESMANNHGWIAIGLRSLAKSAARLIARLTRHDPGSVTSIARWRASDADTDRPVVYDLTVERHQCYKANGFLVSNSDAFRYGIYDYRPSEVQYVMGKPVYINEQRPTTARMD